VCFYPEFQALINQKNYKNKDGVFLQSTFTDLEKQRIAIVD